MMKTLTEQDEEKITKAENKRILRKCRNIKHTFGYTPLVWTGKMVVNNPKLEGILVE